LQKIPPLIALVFAVECVLAIAMLLTGFLPYLPETLKLLFHAGRESSVPTWFSTIQLALVGLLFLCLFLYERRRGGTAPGRSY